MQPSESFFSFLPPPTDGLSAPPDLTGERALAIVHDMNPYLTFLPLEEPGAPLAARLVVVSGADWDPRLAWEVRYRYVCWKPNGATPPRTVTDSAYAYVDARAGSLVYGRDTRRGGAFVSDQQHTIGLGCFAFPSSETSDGPSPKGGSPP